MDERDEDQETPRHPADAADGERMPADSPRPAGQSSDQGDSDSDSGDSGDSDEFGIGALKLDDALSESDKDRVRARTLELPVPDRCIGGRYELRERLGGGGMGTVYAGYDRQLERAVAIKRLHKRFAQDSSEASERLKREAIAMAQFASEPNVVQVYDIVADHDQAFLIMELISGTTLEKVQRKHSPSQAEIIDIYLQAGRGLAAIHRAHLVHRDFKPANVMIADNPASGHQRVIVCDLGLAITRALATSSSDSEPPSEPRPRALGEQFTATRALAGTPVYMAPEQLRGERDLDGRCDQFAFCVALYEALSGTRPFAEAEAGAKSEPLLAAIPAGPPPLPKRDGGAVPVRVEQALRRGLAFEPGERFPDMDALLVALAPPERFPWSVWLSLGLALALGATLLLLGRDAAPSCESQAQSKAAGLVDASALQRSEQRIPAQHRHAWLALRDVTTQRVNTWREEMSASCDAERRNDDDNAAPITARKQACLLENAAVLRTAGSYLTQEENESAPMFELADALRRMPSCIHLREEPKLVPPADAASQSIMDEFHEVLAESELREYEGRYDSAVELAGEALRQSEAMSFPYKDVLAAKARFRLSRAHAYAGDHNDAAENFDQAARAAAGFQLGAESLEGALFHAKYLLADLEKSTLAWEQLVRAELLLGWLGVDCEDADDAEMPMDANWRIWACAEYDEANGLLASRLGELEQAIAYHEQALQWRERLSPAPPALDAFLHSKSLNNLANAEANLARQWMDEGEEDTATRYWDSAAAHYQAALRLRGEALGNDHPLVDRIQLNIRLLQVARGQEIGDDLLRLGLRVLAQNLARSEVQLESLPGWLVLVIDAALGRYYGPSDPKDRDTAHLQSAAEAAAFIRSIHAQMPPSFMQHRRRVSEYLALAGVSEAKGQWSEALAELEHAFEILDEHDAATTCDQYLQNVYRSTLFSAASIVCAKPESEPEQARSYLKRAFAPLADCAAADAVIDAIYEQTLMEPQDGGIPANCHP